MSINQTIPNGMLIKESEAKSHYANLSADRQVPCLRAGMQPYGTQACGPKKNNY